MKKIFVGVLVLVGVFAFSTMSLGKVVVIENSKGGAPVVIEKSDYTLLDIPELAGQPCKGFK